LEEGRNETLERTFGNEAPSDAGVQSKLPRAHGPYHDQQLKITSYLPVQPTFT
jgi:hypothetical protein